MSCSCPAVPAMSFAPSSAQIFVANMPITSKAKRSAPTNGSSSSNHSACTGSGTGTGAGNGTGTVRPVKRRASKACQCCRNRKVRCNVTEHGAPCTNCRLDEVECIVSESRRKRKWSKEEPKQSSVQKAIVHPQSNYSFDGADSSYEPNFTLDDINLSVETAETYPNLPPNGTFLSPVSPFQPTIQPSIQVPAYIKPLPSRIAADEAQYLASKGALTLPSDDLRNELIRSYIEFVHPFMPVLDIIDFVTILDSGNDRFGRLSLILYHALMFAGSAFIDIHHLYSAGYNSRKHARRDLFQRTRLLYDFDYESDRVSLVQALLLLTYYYETPDDQKDTWHWMGVATSVAHTIGLHRNPENSTMDPKKIKLWKRIWWSTYMRDRLIALGMRRPTRIKDDDYDVPMIQLEDFELVAVPDSISCVTSACKVARDVKKQKQLAILCIQKAQLCLCISQVLSRQYCVLNNNQGVQNDRTTMMLLPKKLDPERMDITICDNKLQEWFNSLGPDAQRCEEFSGDACIDLNKALLFMTYYATLSALHRPQVFPGSAMQGSTGTHVSQVLALSRLKVREAATRITALAQAIDSNSLVKYLPTTGITVLLPAIIIHLLDIKDPSEETRRKSLRGFCQCMNVLYKLRDMYQAADYSIAFLDAAVRKAGIQVSTLAPTSSDTKIHPVMTVEDLIDAGRRLDMIAMPPPAAIQQANVLTPPPDMASPPSVNVVTFATHMLMAEHHDQMMQNQQSNNIHNFTPNVQSNSNSKNSEDTQVLQQIGSYLNSTPPSSEHGSSPSTHMASLAATGTSLFDVTTISDNYNTSHQDLFAFNKSDGASILPSGLGDSIGIDDFDSLIDLDALVGKGGGLNFDDGGVHGFTHDMDWLGQTINNDENSRIVL